MGHRDGSDQKPTNHISGYSRRTKVSNWSANWISSISRDFRQNFGGLFRRKGNISLRILTRDTLLLKQGGDGEALDAYYNLLSDPHVWGCIDRLVSIILAQDTEFSPGGDDEKSMAAYQFCKEYAKAYQHAIDKIYETFTFSVVLGVTHVEPIWGAWSGRIAPTKYKSIDSRRIDYYLTRENNIETINPKIRSTEHIVEGEAIPNKKIISCRYHAVPLFTPYGFGTGHQMKFLVEIKHNAVDLVTQISDKFGFPISIMNVPEKASTDVLDYMLENIRTMASNANFVLPPGFMLDIKSLESTSSVKDLLIWLVDYCEEKISQVILGEAITGSKLAEGSISRDSVASGIVNTKAMRISRLIDSTLNETLFTWITEKNFPGAKPPRIRREFATSQELKDLSQMLATLNGMGFVADPTWIEDKFNIPQKQQEVAEAEGLIGTNVPDIEGALSGESDETSSNTPIEDDENLLGTTIPELPVVGQDEILEDEIGEDEDEDLIGTEAPDIDNMAERGPRGGIRKSKKAPKSDTPNPDPKGRGTAKGSAKGKTGAKVTETEEKALKKKVDEFNERYKEKLGYGVTLGQLKSVLNRGKGAFNTSHSPSIKSASAWGQARVNAFLYLVKSGRPENKNYTQDNDLLPSKHPKAKK